MEVYHKWNDLIFNSADYETKASYNMVINVNDGSGDFAKALHPVTNINEAPTDLGFASSSLLENGLVLYLDSRNPNSYSGSGNTWMTCGNGNDFIMVYTALQWDLTLVVNQLNILKFFCTSNHNFY